MVTGYHWVCQFKDVECVDVGYHDIIHMLVAWEWEYISHLS